VKNRATAKAEVGDAIAEAVGYALDQTVQAQQEQLVGDCALGHRRLAHLGSFETAGAHQLPSAVGICVHGGHS
jgi:hypothetical protein